MGTRGPKPLPDNVHRLNGNPSKKNFGSNSPGVHGSEVPVEIPEPPDHLNEAALKEWHSISADLFRLGLIARIDKAMLATYCINYARWQTAERKLEELGDDGLIQKSGKGYAQIGVWLQISNRAVAEMKSACAEFGMSPSARVRVNPNPQFDLFGTDGDEKSTGSSKAKGTSPSNYFSS